MKPTCRNKVNGDIVYDKNDSECINNMNEEKKQKRNHKNKIICSICLNSETEDKVKLNKQKGEPTKLCPICNKSYAMIDEKVENNTDRGHRTSQRVIEITTKDKHTNNTKTKSVQTVNSESKSIILLNEVLAEFQSKKTENVKSKAKQKDASVSTNDISRANDSKLSVNMAFEISIDPNKATENERFVVYSNRGLKRNLYLHKSSSIPQTQLEQLKHSLKVKHKSKDVIDEVNRLFATINRTPDDIINRPSIRNGPKVLPVVQTIAALNEHKQHDSPNLTSKCCQISCLSSGDFQCHHVDEKHERCDKCVFMMTCNYKNQHRIHRDMVICERCRTEVPLKSSGHSFDS